MDDGKRALWTKLVADFELSGQSQRELAFTRAWMADTYNMEPPKSPIAKACYYAIARYA